MSMVITTATDLGITSMCLMSATDPPRPLVTVLVLFLWFLYRFLLRSASDHLCTADERSSGDWV